MRLLNTSTGELKWFNDPPPPYAILSHVWGEHEQSFQEVSALAPGPPIDGVHHVPDVPNRFPITPARYSRLSPSLSNKIRGACMYALKLGFEWIWIDTCCIDKTSSAELSEAINSMYKWYSSAELCVAYLEDVQTPPDSSMQGLGPAGPLDHGWPPHPTQLSTGHLFPPLSPRRYLHYRTVYEFQNSNWFKRGWTLQELVSPRAVEFVSREWKPLGTKIWLADELQEITGIDVAVLRDRRKLSDVCVAVRMGWASRRITTRVEDRAYSLLGIFGISMPTLYGEGEKAFERLQEHIMSSSPDQTLFAWGDYGLRNNIAELSFSRGDDDYLGGPLLARSPASFSRCESMTTIPLEEIPVATEAFVEKFCQSRFPEVSRSPLPLDTPSFTKSSHGIRAWVPLIRVYEDASQVIAVIAAKCEDGYAALLLQRITTSSSLCHYTSRELLVSGKFNILPRQWYHYKHSVEWADIYIRPWRKPSQREVIPILKIPFWVTKKVHASGFP